MTGNKGVQVSEFVENLTKGVEQLGDALQTAGEGIKRLEVLSHVLGDRWEDEELRAIGLTEEDIKTVREVADVIVDNS